jgi:hypothetical protein
MRHTDVQSDLNLSNLHSPASTEQGLSPQPVNLNALIKQCAEILLPLLGRNIRLKCFFANDLFPVQIEPRQIDEILRGFFLDARNRIGTTDAVLLIQTNNFRLERKSQAYAVVTIANAEEAAVATLKTKPRNTVLSNLTVIDRIVKDNGGFVVDVHGRPEQTAEVKLYLPAAV